MAPCRSASTLRCTNLYDPKSGKLQFNLEDDRNNLNIMLSDADAMAAELEGELDGDYSG